MAKTNIENLATEKSELFTEVEYQRGSANHVVYSPTRDLPALGVASYGMHKRGDIFHVLKSDQKARPEWFKVVEVVQVVEDEPKPKRRRSRKKSED